MKTQEVENLLHQISLDILRYEDGDLMLVSQIIDRVSDLRRAYPAGTETARLFDLSDRLLRCLFKGASYKTIDHALAKGVDLLSHIAAIALRESREIDSLSAAEITRHCGGEMALFAVAAENVLAAAPESEAVNSGTADRGRKELELRLTGEPFKVFLSEAEEKIIRAQDYILELEKDAGNKKHVNELFRVFHTIKGECGFLRIASLGELAHNLENLLDLLREDRLKVDAELIDLLLSGVDCVRQMLGALKSGNLEAFGGIDISALIQRVNAALQGAKTNIGAILLEQGKLNETEVEAVLRKQKEDSFTRKFGEIAVDEKLITQAELDETLQRQASGSAPGARAEAARDSIVKVKASQINFLVDMVGELIITEAQLEERTRHLGQLRKITREIQYAAMQLRTEKVKNLFINMKRVARDAAKQLGKRVAAKMKGEDLEIDRDLVEKLEEPLMHLVRNAVAHGIEREEERLRQEKPAEGSVAVEAERRGNTIVVAVEDDGRGLDREKILAKAVAKGLIEPAEAPQLSDEDAYDFIFRQGFSTAENVDFVSGRGVGMDIVKTVAASSRGRVEIKTEAGAFTRIEMIFPLSTAIIDGMIVRSGGTFFIIPVANVIESLRLERERIHTVKNSVEVIDLRGEIIPIIRLDDFFGRNGNGSGNGGPGGRIIGVIVETNARKKAVLLLDEIITKREVFIKALGAKFKNLKGISSGTILQGGTVGFVLDVDQVTRESGAAPAAAGIKGTVGS